MRATPWLALFVGLAFAPPVAAQTRVGDDPVVRVPIVDLVRRMAELNGERFVVSREARERSVELIRPGSLSELGPEALRRVYRTSLAAAGLVAESGGDQTRIRSVGAASANADQYASAPRFLVAMVDMSQVSLGRFQRLRDRLEALRADIVYQPGSNRMLVVDRGASVDSLVSAVSALDVPWALVRVPARGQGALWTQLEAVHELGMQSQQRTWRRTGGGGIVSSGRRGSAPAKATKSMSKRSHARRSASSRPGR